MQQHLIEDLQRYFNTKGNPTKEELDFRRRLSEGYFPITSLHRDDLDARGFDTNAISDSQMKRLARKMADDYCEQLFWGSLDILAESLGFPKKKNRFCPKCHSADIRLDTDRLHHCNECSRTWDDDLYVLVEFSEDASSFEEENIGYPSWKSNDNGARYVSEYDYIEHLGKSPDRHKCYRLLRWPESQEYLYPNALDDAIDDLCEPIGDEQGIADFGAQAVWVPLCLLNE